MADGAQWIADFMGDAGCEAAERGELELLKPHLAGPARLQRGVEGFSLSLRLTRSGWTKPKTTKP